MTVLPLDSPVRRRLTGRQAVTLACLIEAAATEVRERGYDGMTVRGAARRAGVAAATAYTLFASKDHLLAEVVWRRMLELLAVPPATEATPEERVAAELRLLGTFMADDPALAAAGTTALLRPGPDVEDLRVRIGTAAHDRLALALGPGAHPALLQSLDLLYSGALLWMGMGHLAPERVPDALTDGARLLMASGT